MYGRGAVDMKPGVAAFVAAAIDFAKDTPPDGSIVIAITGDEEGDAVDGTTAILDWMAQNNEKLIIVSLGAHLPRDIWRYDENRSARITQRLFYGQRDTGPFCLSSSGKKPTSCLGPFNGRFCQSRIG